MGKFDPFGMYLSRQDAEILTLTFQEIESIVGFTLCKSAYNYDAYWQPAGHNSIANVIIDYGYKADKIDLANQCITLRRG